MTSIPESARELEPCLFCNGKYVTDRHVRDGRQMFCQNCGASVAPTYHGPNNDTLARAIAAWNTRARLAPDTSAPADVGELIERLRIVERNLAENGGYDNFARTVCEAADALARLSRAAPAACLACKGTGTEADYVGDDMRPVEVECSRCKGTGVSAAPAGDEVVAPDDVATTIALLQKLTKHRWPEYSDETLMSLMIVGSQKAADLLAEQASSLSSSKAEIAELRRELEIVRENHKSVVRAKRSGYAVKDERTNAAIARAESAEQALEAAAAERDQAVAQAVAAERQLYHDGQWRQLKEAGEALATAAAEKRVLLDVLAAVDKQCQTMVRELLAEDDRDYTKGKIAGLGYARQFIDAALAAGEPRT